MSDRITKTGSFVGAGSAQNITTLGFRPRLVRVWNKDGLVSAYWNKEMPDASAWKELNHGTVQRAFITSDGITPLNNGFTFGADSDLNVSGETCYFEAHD